MTDYKTSSLEELLMTAPSGAVIVSALVELAAIDPNVVVGILNSRGEWMKKLTQADWLPLLQSTVHEIRLTAIRLHGSQPLGDR